MTNPNIPSMQSLWHMFITTRKTPLKLNRAVRFKIFPMLWKQISLQAPPWMSMPHCPYNQWEPGQQWPSAGWPSSFDTAYQQVPIWVPISVALLDLDITCHPYSHLSPLSCLAPKWLSSLNHHYSDPSSSLSLPFPQYISPCLGTISHLLLRTVSHKQKNYWHFLFLLYFLYGWNTWGRLKSALAPWCSPHLCLVLRLAAQSQLKQQLALGSTCLLLPPAALYQFPSYPLVPWGPIPPAAREPSWDHWFLPRHCCEADQLIKLCKALGKLRVIPEDVCQPWGYMEKNLPQYFLLLHNFLTRATFYSVWCILCICSSCSTNKLVHILA